MNVYTSIHMVFWGANVIALNFTYKTISILPFSSAAIKVSSKQFTPLVITCQISHRDTQSSIHDWQIALYCNFVVLKHILLVQDEFRSLTFVNQL